VIVDERGQPIMATAHYAADQAAAELAGWYPQSYSADAEWLGEMDVVRARTHDMIRNSGLINGAIQTQVDNLVGAGLRLSAKPDWMALGIKDADAAAQIEDRIEVSFNGWANDNDCYCDASRQLTFGGMVAQAARMYFASFEVFASAEWLPRPGAKFATALQMIDPMRISNPIGRPQSTTLRSGVEFDAMGAPIAYHISSRVPGDAYMAMGEPMLTWRRVPRETPWGRRSMIHIFEQERPGQSRGKGGIVSVLARGRMLDKNEQAHLQAAIQNAMFATVVVSPLDWQSVGGALGAGDPNDPVLTYVANKAAFHKESTIRFGGAKVPHLYPGEELKHLQASHPHANFDSFERFFQRHMAAGMNMTYEQFSRDYSQTNYSGHRAALLDYWRFITGRRSHIVGRFATLIYALWLEEAMDRGEIDIPAGTPSFLEAKTAWSGCEWIGPGRGQIDPLKEANATKVDLSSGLTTIEIEAAERGRDWRALMRQTAQERKYAKTLETEFALDPGTLSFGGPTPVEQPPDAPEPERRQQTEGATA
jgi:lambda family phage portal protein